MNFSWMIAKYMGKRALKNVGKFCWKRAKKGIHKVAKVVVKRTK